MKLSILICVYNTPSELLGECLESLAPSAGADTEICIFDDGSDISYAELLGKYGVRYQKEENRGIFAARRAALQMARGDYVAFVDSDDTVSLCYHAPMLSAAERTGSDIVMGDWAFHTERTRYFCKSDYTLPYGTELSGDDVLCAYLKQCGRDQSYYVLWNKIYRRELLAQAIEQTADATSSYQRYGFSEDALINFFAFRDAARLRVEMTGYYFYRIHTGQTINTISKESLRHHIGCMSNTLSVMERMLPSHMRAQLVSYVDQWRAMMARTHVSYARRAGYTELYDDIRDGYGVSKLRGATLRDSAAYIKNTPMADNVDEVERALRARLLGKEGVVLDERTLGTYARRMVALLVAEGWDIRFSPTGERFVKERTSLKKRILHSRLVYTVALMLFPKGSRIRAFLKKRL